MTTPKPPTLAMWTAIDADAKQPFRELAEEFRRLAADLKQGLEKAKPPGDSATLYAHGWAAGRADALEQAAQMLEERLNG